MNSQINLINKKKNFAINSIIKPNYDKKHFSSRANTQEIFHHNHSKNKSSSYKSKKIKNINSSLYNNKNEEIPKRFTTNISTKINSDTNSKINSNKIECKSLNIYEYKDIINQREKKIAELERQIKIYRDKLRNQIRVFNINSSINSFNLSKTRSSTNITERNMYQIRSLSNSQIRIKTSFQMAKNLYGKKNVGNKMNINKNNKSKNQSKKRAKSNNYKNPKINNFIFGNKIINYNKHINNFKRNETNSKQKYKNKFQNINIMNYKRAKSSNIEKNKKNKSRPKSNAKINNKNDNLLSIEETQYLCDKMIEKMKNVLELVKMATTED